MASEFARYQHGAQHASLPALDIELPALAVPRFLGILEHGAFDDSNSNVDNRSTQRLLEDAQGLPEEREAEQKAAKAYIARSRNGKDLLQRAEEVVRDEWMATTRSLPGNIYRCTAFGKHIGNHFGERSLNGLKAAVRLVGFVTVWVVQVTGPPAIFISNIFGLGLGTENHRHWEKWRSDGQGFFAFIEEWQHVAFQKMLTALLIYIFCLHGLYSVLDEAAGWKKVDAIFRYLQRITPNCTLPGEKYLFLGAMTNCWVVIWCCIDAYLIIGPSVGPKNAIMDSLGLLFLFNLDDISGDVAFVSEDAWPGHCLGWVYENMVDDFYEPEGMELAEIKITSWKHRMMYGFQIFTALLVGLMSLVLPILSCLTPFRLIFEGIET